MLGRRSATPGADGAAPVDESGHSVVLDGVDVMRGARLALRDVSFALEPGTLTSVVGPNGAGKSSLFGVLSGRLRPSRGSVHIRGSVAEVLQNTALNEYLHVTVDDVARMGRYPARGLFGPMRGVDRQIINEALAATDLLDLRRRSIHQLSGGQRQRALVAQGLAQRAPVLLLDEPSAGLDARSQRELFEIVRAEADRGTTVLMATHDLNEATKCDNMIVLACDCLCCAPPEIAMAEPDVTSLFEPGPQWAWSA